jgi:hypothetical protein
LPNCLIHWWTLYYHGLAHNTQNWVWYNDHHNKQRSILYHFSSQGLNASHIEIHLPVSAYIFMVNDSEKGCHICLAVVLKEKRVKHDTM